MSTSDRLKTQIKNQTDVVKLTYLKDFGLDMILADADVTDFTVDDKTEITALIVARIAELS